MNYRGVILDLIFTSFSNTEVLPAIDEILPQDLNHPPLYFLLDDKTVKANVNTSSSYNYRRCDMGAVFDWITNQIYPTVSDIQVEDHFTGFCENLAEVIRLNSPIRTHSRFTFPKWFSAELKHMVIQKKICHRRFKETGDPYFYDNFRELRDGCKRLSKECHRNYIDYIESTVPNNIKVFWSHIKNTKTVTTPSNLTYGDAEAEDPISQCEMFANYFSSVYTDVTLPPADFDFGTSVNLHSITVTAQQVEAKLGTLDPNKGMGPDLLPPSVMKYCSSVLAPHISIYFNELLRNGTFPANLKLSYIVPIFKSGAQDKVTNYRPIAIQPVLAKVFESLILDRLAFELKHVITDEQHGFRSGRSTVTNLMVLHNYITSAFGRRHQVDCILLDFSKAFDRVNHSLLIAKLKGYGITGSLLKWLTSYLTNRGLIIKFAGSYSRMFSAASGVPQGSHLAPFLFSIYLGDVCDIIPTRCLMFADDIKIFTEITCLEDCERLQNTLCSIEAWCGRNGMDLNANKSAVLTYCRSSVPTVFGYTLVNSPLNRVHKFKDLGVVMSSSLNPWDHISYTCSRANSLIGFLCRTSRDFQSPSTLAILFKTLIRPILEYSSVVWCPYQAGHINTLESIQIRVIRLIGLRLGYQYLETPIDSLRTLFGLPLLATRRKMADILLLHKLVNGALDCPELLSMIEFRIPASTRSKDIFTKRSSPSLYSYHSCVPRIMREGNAVSDAVDFFGSSHKSFRSSLDRILNSTT